MVDRDCPFNYDNCIVRAHDESDISSNYSFSLMLDKEIDTSGLESSLEDASEELNLREFYILIAGFLNRIQKYLTRSASPDEEGQNLKEASVSIIEAMMASKEVFGFSPESQINISMHNDTSDSTTNKNVTNNYSRKRKAQIDGTNTEGPSPKKTRKSPRLTQLFANQSKTNNENIEDSGSKKGRNIFQKQSKTNNLAGNKNPESPNAKKGRKSFSLSRLSTKQSDIGEKSKSARKTQSFISAAHKQSGDGDSVEASNSKRGSCSFSGYSKGYREYGINVQRLSSVALRLREALGPSQESTPVKTPKKGIATQNTTFSSRLTCSINPEKRGSVPHEQASNEGAKNRVTRAKAMSKSLHVPLKTPAKKGNLCVATANLTDLSVLGRPSKKLNPEIFKKKETENHDNKEGESSSPTRPRKRALYSAEAWLQNLSNRTLP